MAGIHNRFVAAVAIVAIAGLSLTACSKSNKAKTVTQNVSAPRRRRKAMAARRRWRCGRLGAAGDNTLLANGPACQISTAADIQAAVGVPLGNITGDVSGGPQGATNYHSCIWTKDASGTGAAVNVAYGTYAAASGELATEKARDAGTADQLNSLAPNSPTIKDVSVGDGGCKLTTNADDDSVTFTKGQQVVQVEVIKGVAGATMVIARKVASKL